MKWKAGWVLFLIYIVLTPLLLTPFIHSNDPVGYFSYLHSGFFDKDMDLSNEYTHYLETFPDLTLQYSETGRLTNRYTIGTALLWSPFYLLGHGLTLAANTLGGSYPVDGYSYWYILAITFGSSLYAFFGVLLMHRFLRKYFSAFASFTSVLLMWFATPLIVYMWLQPSMSHAISFFLVTAFIYYWWVTRKDRMVLEWCFLGLLAGLASLVRPQNALFAALPLIESLFLYKEHWKIWKEMLSLFLGNVSFLVLVLLVWLPQFLVLRALTGSPFSLGETATFHLTDLFVPKYVFHLLFATHGLWSWTPIFLVACIGLVLFIRKKGTLGWYLLLGFLLQLYLMGTWRGWLGGAAFGQRKFLNCLLIFGVGTAMAITWLREKRIRKWVISLLALLFVGWNFGILLQLGSRMIPAGQPVAYWEIVKNNIVEIPGKLLDIIKTFLFERGKYLKP